MEGVRRKFLHRDIGQEKSWQGNKRVHLLFSIGINIFLCYKYFSLILSKNFIAVALRGQGEGYCLEFAALTCQLGHDCLGFDTVNENVPNYYGGVSWK